MSKAKKLITMLVLLGIFACVCVLTACTAKFERGMKDFTSNVSGGLNRTVTAYSATGEKIGEWSGKIDVEMSDNKVKFDLDGKRTIIYNATVIVQED